MEIHKKAGPFKRQMPEKQVNWSEEYIEALPREDDRIEWKGSAFFKDENRLRDELGKQLSAFANSGGGSVIFGVDKQGELDGGIPVVHKGRQTTKEWLEDIIPSLTDLEILQVRVIDISAGNLSSKINHDSALYVIEIPDSDRAPHQSVSDKRYYVRIGSKSLPAPHRIVEDIRNRSRHPKLEIANVNLNSVHCTDEQCSLDLQVRIKNEGKIISNHSCLGIRVDAFKFNVFASQGCHGRAGSDSNSPLFELDNTLYPDLSIALNVTIKLFGEPQIGNPSVFGSQNFFVDNVPVSDKNITFILYAESATARSKTFNVASLDLRDGLIRKAMATYLHNKANRSSNTGFKWH